ncbi:MAG: glycoside hydrolase family 127 protein, partial [Chloroflexi bacterium]|nr:glycoside hydrolase family 127 protein [Chloroflexota bacterium]
GDGQYADAMERVLHNGAIIGVSLDGRRFFYENPLASRGDHHRQEWYDCACCPPNIARLIASLGGYFYSQSDDGAWVHLFAQGEARLRIGGREVTLKQTTTYPWDGSIKIEVIPSSPLTFALHVRVPGWCEAWEVNVNGEPAAPAISKGYIRLTREWKPGDVVTLNLAMPVRYVHANPNIRQTLGRVALQRGPMLYCLEGVDHDGLALDRISVSVHDLSSWQAEFNPGLLGGVTVLRGHGMAVKDEGWGDELYRFDSPQARPIDVMAVPYCVWDNRVPGEMRVWMRGGGVRGR